MRAAPSAAHVSHSIGDDRRRDHRGGVVTLEDRVGTNPDNLGRNPAEAFPSGDPIMSQLVNLVEATPGIEPG
jgi:hypothetical protein